MVSNVKDRLLALAVSARREDGQGLAEYALILGLVAIACIGALTLLGTSLASSSGFVDLPARL